MSTLLNLPRIRRHVCAADPMPCVIEALVSARPDAFRRYHRPLKTYATSSTALTKCRID